MISIVEGPRQCCLTPAANRRQTCCQTRASRRSWSVASQESSCERLRRAKEIQLVLRAHRFVLGDPATSHLDVETAVPLEHLGSGRPNLVLLLQALEVRVAIGKCSAGVGLLLLQAGPLG